jgi:4'-phosphopantetheinyl transferase
MRGLHVWRASLTRPADEVAALYQHLDDVERSRAARFRKQDDHRRFIVARATLRLLLGDYTDLAPGRVPLCVLPSGKPALDRESTSRGPHFNLSHCGEIALFAFADREVGIDVEEVARHREMERVAAHFFSPRESAAFRRLGGNEQARFFCRTWVRKEAYLKATGDGFAIDPSLVSVDDRFAVYDLPDMGDHLAAVAVAGIIGTGEIEIRQVVQ